jgi:hypothetical protein
VSIDVGYEETISESEGYSVPIDCPSGQRGISKSCCLGQLSVMWKI